MTTTLCRWNGTTSPRMLRQTREVARCGAFEVKVAPSYTDVICGRIGRFQ